MIRFIKEVPFFDQKEKKGLKSRAKSREKEAMRVRELTNRAISAVRQMSTGSLDDELLVHEQKGFPTTVGSKKGRAVADMMMKTVSRAYKERPSETPTGAAAISRLLGADSSPSPALKTSAAKPAPRRGDIWPAVIEDIALPPTGTKPVLLTQVSSTAAAYLNDFKSKMLKPKSPFISTKC